MSTSEYEQELNNAAGMGDINDLYTIIQKDPFVLDRIDSIPFVETPLHVGAYVGHVQFAKEVMRLKPSYAYKLNPQGFSPIHLVMQRFKELINQQGADPDQLAIQKFKMEAIMNHFSKTDENILRVKGREGITPLHFASENGIVDLLPVFLLTCPESINDVTIRGETALHIAVKYNQFDALQVLVGWLKGKQILDDKNLESKILNKRDDEGNTVLHMSTLSTDSMALQLLLKTRVYLNAKNLSDLTALDMVATTNAEMKNILSSAGVKPGSLVENVPTYAQRLISFNSKMSFMETFTYLIFRFRNTIPEVQRNTFLIAATLVATCIYQSSLSPPGGVYQQDNNNNEIMNTTVPAFQINLGKSVLSGNVFLFFSIWNSFSFLLSLHNIFYDPTSFDGRVPILGIVIICWWLCL